MRGSIESEEPQSAKRCYLHASYPRWVVFKGVLRLLLLALECQLHSPNRETLSDVRENPALSLDMRAERKAEWVVQEVTRVESCRSPTYNYKSAQPGYFLAIIGS